MALRSAILTTKRSLFPDRFFDLAPSGPGDGQLLAAEPSFLSTNWPPAWRFHGAIGPRVIPRDTKTQEPASLASTGVAAPVWGVRFPNDRHPVGRSPVGRSEPGRSEPELKARSPGDALQANAGPFLDDSGGDEGNASFRGSRYRVPRIVVRARARDRCPRRSGFRRRRCFEAAVARAPTREGSLRALGEPLTVQPWRFPRR